MNIFWSQDPLAQIVILVNAAFFAGWLIYLLLQWVRLSKEAGWFRELADVSFLLQRSRGVEGVSPSLETRDQVYAEYLEYTEVPNDSTAARHVKLLHDAGWSDTRLDVSELVRFTSTQLLSASGALRSVLGVFIVVGLFGTLAGLSQALGPLSELNLTAGVPAGLDQELTSLLDKLKSAFAPSVVGVLLTVVGVLIFATYNGLVAAPLRNLVDHLTISTWLPKLYPTTSQRVLATLEEAERQSHENLQAAQQVAQFASRLESDLADFGPEVERANGTLKAFDTALEKATSAASAISAATSELTSFKTDLRTAYKATGEHTAQVGSAINRMSEQVERLSEGVRVLRVFEETYVEGLQRDVSALLTSAREAIDSLGERNEEVVHAVGTPLVQRLEEIDEHLNGELSELGSKLDTRLGNVNDSLNEHLRKVDATLYERLSAVREGIGGIEDPVNHSAARIEGIADAFDKSVGRLLGELKREFDRQNQQNAQSQQNIAEMRSALGAVADELRRASARQDRLVEDIAALAHRAERVGPLTRFLRKATRQGANGRRTGGGDSHV